MPRHIIALGGGGFSDEPDNHLLDDYILAQCMKPSPKICFIPTASGDAQGYIDMFYQAFQRWPCQASHVSLFRGHTDRLEAFVMAQDILYVGGGNTRNMLALWREWGLDQMIRNAYARGTILCGVSAGSICWFDYGLTDSIPNHNTALPCLGLIPGSNSPHFSSQPDRRQAFASLIRTGRMPPGIAADDCCALHYVDARLYKVVASRPNAHAYSFRRIDDQITETKMPAELLG